MKVLITGGAGYIGSHLCKHLIERGHNIVVVDNLRSGNSPDYDWMRNSVLYGTDINSPFDLESVFAVFQPDVVYHLAALIDAHDSMGSPLDCYHTNVAGSINVIRNCHEYDVKHLVFASTAGIYANSDKAVTEASLIGPQNPYAESKLMVEKILRDYHMAYERPYSIFRFFNVIGCDPSVGIPSNKRDLLSVLLRCIKDGSPFTVNGTELPTHDGTPVRDFVDVNDLCGALLIPLEDPSYFKGTYNVGSQHGFSVLDMVKAAQEVTERDIEVVYALPRDGDPVYSRASTRLLRTISTWNPQVSLQTSIENAWRSLNERT